MASLDPSVDRPASPLLAMRGIVRSFGALRANDGIDLTVEPGHILGLLGENGSGKSTLMKVLFGMLPSDEGTITFRGRQLSGHHPRQAMEAGIAMIHQHFMLVEAMTVVENVMLGWSEAGRVLKRKEVAARVRSTSQRFGLDLDPDAQIGELPLGRRQRVEILKAIMREAELLVLDEPTSNLAPSEVAELLAILRRLKSEGKGIIFISHKLPEILDVCDDVVVLRLGRVTGRCAVAGASRAQLAEMMVGRDISTPHALKPREPGPVRLMVRDLVAPGLSRVSFEIRGGEILGVAGVDGNGQLELVETIAGLRRVQSGAMELDGKDITRAPVSARIAGGMAYMPADRGQTALVRAMSIADNLMLRDSSREPYARGWLLDGNGRAAKAKQLMAQYDVRAPGPGANVARLSGGNQQKIVVARELDRAPAVLIAHQAAWGLDPGATRSVLDRVISLREQGAAVLYVSSELEDVLAVSDRIAVMAGGAFAGVVARAEADLRQIGLWMAGRAA
jgi:general nucleoside transport system ATP-binding protein